MSLFLADITLDHACEFVDWVADKQAVKYSLTTFLPDRDEQWVKSFILSLIESRTSWNQVIVVDNEVVGYCGLSGISQHNRSAEYFILIGNSNYWNRGIGTCVGEKVLNHGFTVLGLHRIWLTVSEFNHGAIKSYKNLGFSEEGRMIDACFRDNTFHDKIVMSIVKMHS